MDAYHDIRRYIEENPVMTLSTTDANGTPHGAAVYGCPAEEHPVVYFITKLATQKFQNLQDHPLVSITIVNTEESSTLQASGRTYEVADAATIDMVMKKIADINAATKEWLMPIAKLRAGAYSVVAIELTSARLAHYKGATIGDKRIFTKL